MVKTIKFFHIPYDRDLLSYGRGWETIIQLSPKVENFDGYFLSLDHPIFSVNRTTTVVLERIWSVSKKLSQ